MKTALKEGFIKEFNIEPTDYFSSSGRIEILGNHTDHNHGLVLVSAVNLDIICSCIKTNDNKIEIYSEGFSRFEVDLSNLKRRKDEEGKSISLVKGVAKKIKEQNYIIGGFKAYIKSNVPSGSGISSSAAFECLITEIFNYYYNENSISKMDIAKVSQYAENVYFNKPCGLLDQCGVAFGGINMIDFKSTKNPIVTHIETSFDPYDIILVNCGGDHSALTPYYSSIKEEMEQVANFFNKKTLRDVPYSKFYNSLNELRNKVSDRAILRAFHYYNENKLVKKAFKCIKKHNIKGFLRCINESGESSYMYLQNTCTYNSYKQNLNLALRLSKELIKDGACRIHGGGFEGTILAFVHKNESDLYIKKMSEIYGKNSIYKVNSRNCGPIHL